MLERLDKYASIFLVLIAMGLWVNALINVFYTDMLIDSVTDEVSRIIEEKGVTARVSSTIYCTSGNVTIIKEPGEGSNNYLVLLVFAGLLLFFLMREIIRG